MKLNVLSFVSLALLGALPAYAQNTCSLNEGYQGRQLSTRTVTLKETPFTTVLEMSPQYYQHPFHLLEIEARDSGDGRGAKPQAVWLSNGSARAKYGELTHGQATVFPLLHWDFGGTEPDSADFHYRVDVQCH